MVTGYITIEILADGIVDMHNQNRVWDNRNMVSNLEEFLLKGFDKILRKHLWSLLKEVQHRMLWFA